MFKKASLKINSASNSNDLRPIQCLLTAEKAVLQSLQKLSADYTKAAEALKNWGLSEDNDLGGILTASTSLFTHFSSALSQYVSHGQTMQRQLEVMAKKGETLDNLKQRRNATHQKVEDTAHQLNKMNPDNKYYSMHSDALKRLRKDVRKMDEDIRLEETILIDHKQTATKVWMRLKFHGLYECCEKGAIAGKYGKLVTAEFEGLEDINQPGMPRNLNLQSKIESFIVEADRHVNAVGVSVLGSRSAERNIQESNAPSAGSYTTPQTAREEPPHPPPKPYDRSQNAQPSYSGNGSGHFSVRQDSSFPPSTGRPYVPPLNQQQLSQGSVNPSRTSPQPYSRVNEGAVDDFGANGTISGPNNSRGQFGSSESGGQSLGGPAVGGLRRDSSFSESNAGPSRLQDPPPPSHWQQQPTSHYQNAYNQYPVQIRPSESAYPPQDPPSQGGRHQLTGEPSYSSGHKPQYSADHKSSYPAGPPHWQNSPVVMRPPDSSESRYPPSQGGSHPNGDSSYTSGPPHLQSPPVVMRPPDSSESRYPPSQGGGHPNGDPSYSSGPSHLQSPPVVIRPPVSSESGYYPSQDGSHLKHNSAGSSHLQSPPSDRFTTPPRPPGPPEPGRYPMQEPPPLGGRHPGDSSSGGYPSHSPPTSHWQNHPSDRFPVPPPPPPLLGGGHGNPSHLQPPNNTAPNGSSESGRYPSQDPPSLDGRHRSGSSSYSETTTGTSHWNPTTNRYSGVSESTTATTATSTEGMTRAREGSYNNQSMHAWGDPDDSPPAYVLMGNSDPIVSDTGPKKKW